jgi:hypothetical protein
MCRVKQSGIKRDASAALVLSSRPSFASPRASARRSSCACLRLAAPPSAEFFHLRSDARPHAASKVSGWPKICKLAHAYLWEYSYKGLKLAQLLGRIGVFLTCFHGHEVAPRGQPRLQAPPRVRSHCHFRKRGTEYVSGSGMKWMSRWYKATMRPSPSATACACVHARAGQQLLRHRLAAGRPVPKRHRSSRLGGSSGEEDTQNTPYKHGIEVRKKRPRGFEWPP